VRVLTWWYKSPVDEMMQTMRVTVLGFLTVTSTNIFRGKSKLGAGDCVKWIMSQQLPYLLGNNQTQTMPFGINLFYVLETADFPGKLRDKDCYS